MIDGKRESNTHNVATVKIGRRSITDREETSGQLIVPRPASAPRLAFQFARWFVGGSGQLQGQ